MLSSRTVCEILIIVSVGDLKEGIYTHFPILGNCPSSFYVLKAGRSAPPDGLFVNLYWPILLLELYSFYSTFFLLIKEML